MLNLCLNGTGCPYCAGKKVLKGYNDLKTVNPTLAKEWNYEKNNGLTPEDVMPNSNKKVWWKCSKGHEWQAMVINRNKGRGCPKCYREKRSKQNKKGKLWEKNFYIITQHLTNWH